VRYLITKVRRSPCLHSLQLASVIFTALCCHCVSVRRPQAKDGEKPRAPSAFEVFVIGSMYACHPFISLSSCRKPLISFISCVQRQGRCHNRHVSLHHGSPRRPRQTCFQQLTAVVCFFPQAKVRLQWKPAAGQPAPAVQYTGAMDVMLKTVQHDGVLGLYTVR
jgi:hypothetical protein